MGILRSVITGVVGVGIISAGAWALDNTKRDESGTIVQAGELGVFNFKVGDCITGMPAGSSIDKATGTPCKGSHEQEVYAETYLADESETAPADLKSQADQFCLSMFEQFVGLSYDESALEIVTIYPTPDSWKAGDKEFTCLVSLKGQETLTESLKNSKM
jgi:hypothetical protein